MGSQEVTFKEQFAAEIVLVVFDKRKYNKYTPKWHWYVWVTGPEKYYDENTLCFDSLGNTGATPRMTVHTSGNYTAWVKVTTDSNTIYENHRIINVNQSKTSYISKWYGYEDNSFEYTSGTEDAPNLTNLSEYPEFYVNLYDMIESGKSDEEINAFIDEKQKNLEERMS